jgi:pilus assembly protein CpaF
MSAPVRPVLAGAPLVDRVRERLASTGGEITPAMVAKAVRAEAGGVVSDVDVLAALRLLAQEFTGAGALEPLLRDPATTDVLVTGPDAVWVDRGDGLVRTGLSFPDEASVRRLAQRLALAAGRRLDDASPYVDARLPGSGVRLHAVLAPIAAGGTCLSLRTLRPAVHDLDALRRLGTLDDTAWRLLHAIVEARLAFLIAGGTASGKTTLLSALLGAVPPKERVLCVEDAEELRPVHPHVVRLVARPANIEGAGAVTLRELVRQALRMRPDRLVVGEVRGAEVCDLLAALNTGHEGGAGTVHANSAREVPARLEALAALGGMSREALHSQLAAAVQVLLHVARGRDGARRLEAVAVLDRSGAEVTARSVWQRGTGWMPARSRLAELLAERGVRPPW